MKKIQPFLGIISATIIAVSILVLTSAIAGIGYLQVNQLKTENKTTIEQLKNQAIDGCLQASQFTWSEYQEQDKTLTNTTTEPTRYWFNVCMQEKGYQASVIK